MVARVSTVWIALFVAIGVLQSASCGPACLSFRAPRAQATFLSAKAAESSRKTSKAASDDTKSLAARTAQVRQYFQEKGIEVQQIPKAIILYEVTSAGFMFGIWGLCYLLQPVQRGLLIAKLAKPGAFESAMAKGQKLLKESKRKNAMRLVTAYAEGAVLRTAVKPIIIPLKLFVTWKVQQAVDAFVSLRRGKQTPPQAARKP